MIKSTTVSTYYTEIIGATNTGGVVISFLSFTNIANKPSTLNVYLVRAGEDASDNNIFIKALEFPVNETLISEGEYIYLSQGDKIIATCDTAQITAVCSYSVH